VRVVCTIVLAPQLAGDSRAWHREAKRLNDVFMQGLMAQPIWLKAWLGWMILVNMGSLLFLKRVEARWVFGAFMGAGVAMMVLAEINGYNRLLGLGHVIFWTPVLVYFFLRRERIDYGTAFGKWAIVLFVTYAVSLVVDYIDVIRYVLGERG
jgi:dolichyl-phosphate-mannose--protein O-mannosyl transferase